MAHNTAKNGIRLTHSDAIATPAGELKDSGRVVSYFSSVSASWGLQAGAQAYSYVVFLITSKTIDYLNTSKGWEIGVGPTVVVVNEGAAKNLSTSTLKDDAYAFIFGQGFHSNKHGRALFPDSLRWLWRGNKAP